MINTVTAYLSAKTSTALADPPKPGDVELPGKVEAKLSTLMGWGMRGLYAILFFAGIGAIVRMGISHQRGEEVNFKSLGTVAIACIAGSSLGAIIDVLYL